MSLWLEEIAKSHMVCVWASVCICVYLYVPWAGPGGRGGQKTGIQSPRTGGTGSSSAFVWVIGIRRGTSARTSALSHCTSLFVCLGNSIIYWPEAHKQARLEFSQSLSSRDTPVSLPSTGIAIVCHYTQPPPHHVCPEDWTLVLMFAR